MKNERVYCKVVNREVIKKNRCPDWDCKTWLSNAVTMIKEGNSSGQCPPDEGYRKTGGEVPQGR